MPCFHPQKAYRAPDGSIKFVKNSAYVDRPVTLPCGQCDGCRLEHSRQWAMRITHEASLHDDNCFITLTYDDDHCPSDYSLCLRDFQLFMKRLRKKFGAGIRFYHCGEYGEEFSRPHYHACIFNHDFHDKKLWKTKNGIKLYTSTDLTDLWALGHCATGALTFASAAYCARYVMKKINGKLADDHYFDSSTGIFRKPEYSTMSRRPGIASEWFKLYHRETYRDDFIVINNTKCKPPKFYDSQYEIINESDLAKIKSARKRKSLRHVDNNTPARLKVREAVTAARISILKREIK